jgi:hypothetical protein
MMQGVQCAVECGVGAMAVGVYTCSLGQILGASTCTKSGQIVRAATGIASEFKSKIATTTSGGRRLISSNWAYSIEYGLEDALGAQMYKTTIMDANNRSNILGNTTYNAGNADGSRRLSPGKEYLIDIGPATGRRLQDEYLVAYEAMVIGSGDIDANTVVERGYSLMDPDSEVFAAFQSSLANPPAGFPALATSDHVLETAPRTYQTSVAVSSDGIIIKNDQLEVVKGVTPVTQVTEEETDTAAIVGGIVGGLVGLMCCCGICYCYYLMRKRLRES